MLTPDFRKTAASLLRSGYTPEQVAASAVRRYMASAGITGSTGRIDALADRAAGFPDPDCWESAEELRLRDLAALSAYVRDPAVRKQNGIVYTPQVIQNLVVGRMLMDENTEKNLPVPVCDPSCGCGAFLLGAAARVRDAAGLPLRTLLADHVYGVDQDEAGLRFAGILFDLAILREGQVPPAAYHLYHADATDPAVTEDLCRQTGGFGWVVGNPPYVRARAIAPETKKNLSAWESAGTGKPDLYIIFFEIGLRMLRPGGRLGYIAPNTFLQSVNGRALRTYLEKHGYTVQIADFGEGQAFRGVTSYTCLVWVSKPDERGKVLYAKTDANLIYLPTMYTASSRQTADAGRPWRLFHRDADAVIDLLENAGRPLGSRSIRAGLAPLRSSLYFFTPSGEDGSCFIRYLNGKAHRIEKEVCVSVVKANTLTDAADLPHRREAGIFPYRREAGRAVPLPEEEMRSRFPNAYSYLCSVRGELDQRTRSSEYPVWYAYGRSQGLANFGPKILLPMIGRGPQAVLCTDPDLQFYAGYGVFSDDEQELQLLHRFLRSAAFWYYLLITSKPYSGGFRSFSKNYISLFTVPEVPGSDLDWFLREDTPQDVLDAYIWDLYGCRRPPDAAHPRSGT